MAKNQNIKIVAPLFLLISTLLVGFIYQINKDNLQDIRSKAEGEGATCSPLCETEPPCCADIIKQLQEKGDISDLPDSEQPYHACPGLYSGQNERGYCRPETCNQLPPGVKYRGRCGWYWSFHDPYTNSPAGYGCMIGNSETTMRPICGNVNQKPTTIPTVPVLPTQIVSVPTQIIIPPTSMPIPTEIVLPPTNPPVPTQILEHTQVQRPQPVVTYIPIVLPTNPPQPTNTPTPTPFKFTLPKILPPKEKVDSFFTTVKTNLLDFFSKILP